VIECSCFSSCLPSLSRYGERGISPGPPFIPPCADIFLDVTMFSWKPCAKERSAMNSAEMFEEAKRVKEEANYAFK
jgi:hypothetical protein